MAGNTAARHVSMAAGRPGRLTISVVPRTPAVCRDRMAVGTASRLARRIASPKPGLSRVIAARGPSGVRSRGAGPVPPVVSTRSAPSASQSATSASRTASAPSGMTRRSGVHRVVMAAASQRSIAGPPRSA